ncbi:MAG TPA: GNAT family N-acetyltransferase [Candidatus Acidoferrales bacterium]|nr:GNAT family N-acetyltransferase [Candidatus Acidoferrales bacterium]
MDLPPPLTDTSPEGLRAALEADSIGTRVLGADLPNEPHLDADASWAVGGVMDPYTNTVVSARFDPATADRRIAEIVAAYDALPAPFLWWRAPFHTPADLGERLEQAHVYAIGEAPAMTLDLGELGPPPGAAAGLEIRGVADEAGLRAYLAVIDAEPPPDGAPPMFPPEKVERIVSHLVPRLAAEPAPLRVVGWLDGRPVGTARLSLAGGVAGIYSVATLPEARGRGIGAALTHACLATGRELGYRIATLQSSDMGFNIYRRLGFATQFAYAIHVHLPGGARFDAG